MNDSQRLVGLRIRRLRQQAKLTQEQLAEKSGLSLKHLGIIERGLGNPSLASLESLAEAMAIPLAALFDQPHEHLSTAELKAEIIRMLDRASAEQYRLLYRMVNDLLN